MQPNTVNDAATGQFSSQTKRLETSKLLEDVQLLYRELLSLGQDHFLLAALETRRAGESLVFMLVAGVIFAVLLSVTWLGILAAAILMLIEHGMPTSSAILLAIAGNLLLMLIVYEVIRRKSCYLQFPAILSCLQSKQQPNTESS